MNIEIKNRFRGAVIWSGDAVSIADAVNKAAALKVSLSSADLRYADLRSANLRYADLRSADLRYAKLSSADLRSANLSSANLRYADLSSANLRYGNLSSADLRYADLRYANLRYADLRSANLRYADLRSANLSYADLRYADLSSANLRYGDLSSADLRYADLRYAEDAALVLARTRILPGGDLIGWKKCGEIIVKLRIPSKAARSHAFGRKCRAQYADVLQVIGAKEATTNCHGPKTVYRKGKRVRPDKWDDDYRNECSNGIHFYITREEAEAH